MIGHNTESGQKLRAFVKRIEDVNDEIERLNDDKKVVFAEAKSDGFDVAILRKVIAARKKKPDALQEEQDLFDTYMHAIGELGAGALFEAKATDDHDDDGVVTQFTKRVSMESF